MHSISTPTHNCSFNGDFSGDVIFTNGYDEVITLPFETIKAVVAEWVRRSRMSALEDQADDQLLLGDQQSG